MSKSTPKAPKKTTKQLVDRGRPWDRVIRMSHPVLAPVLRGYELNEALIPYSRAAECVKIAGVTSLPQVHRRNRPDSRSEGVPGHDEGVVGVCLERGPDVLVDVIRNIFPRIVEAAVHFAVRHGQPSVGALTQFKSAFKALFSNGTGSWKGDRLGWNSFYELQRRKGGQDRGSDSLWKVVLTEVLLSVKSAIQLRIDSLPRMARTISDRTGSRPTKPSRLVKVLSLL